MMTKQLIVGIVLAVAFTNISFASDGEALFKANCTMCHTIGKGKLVGPDLHGTTKRHDDAWLQKWITSSQTMVQAGDPVAVKLFKENGEFPMPDAPISADDIKKVIEYLHNAEIPAKPAVAMNTGIGAHGHNVANPITHFKRQQEHHNMITAMNFSGFMIVFLSIIALIVGYGFFLWIKAKLEAH
ncbi:hypothetical protein MASR2M18_14780 [Ignavibacteria bacterium]|nr:cytochrome c [Bacteroidota bacterium]